MSQRKRKSYSPEFKIGLIRALSSFVYIGWRILWTRIRPRPRYVFTAPVKLDFACINTMLLVASGSKPIGPYSLGFVPL